MKRIYLLFLILLLTSCQEALKEAEVTSISGNNYNTLEDDTSNTDKEDNSINTTEAVYNCPDGYILVNNRIDQPFCVMEFEASLNEFGKITSKLGSNPISNVSFQESFDYCRDIGLNYSLISNKEWMIISSIIQNNPANYYQFSNFENITQGNNGIDNLGAFNGNGVVNYINNKNIFRLNNEQLIFNFSGNLSEWVAFNDDLTIDSGSCSQKYLWINNILSLLTCNTSDIKQEDIYTNEQFWNKTNQGKIYIESQIGYVVRGGSFLDGDGAGINSFKLTFQSNQDFDIGFRCVYRFE